MLNNKRVLQLAAYAAYKDDCDKKNSKPCCFERFKYSMSFPKYTNQLWDCLDEFYTDISVKNAREMFYEIYKQHWLDMNTSETERDETSLAWLELIAANEDMTYSEYLRKFGYNGKMYSDFNKFMRDEFKNLSYIFNVLSVCNPELKAQLLKLYTFITNNQ